MSGLLDDLLDVARITEGKFELRVQPVSLTSIVDTAVEAARPLLDRKNHQLTVALPAEAITLQADPLRLSQVISNLLTNAAKYTDPGGRVELLARRDGDTLVISVKDNGIGIPPDALTRIFTMFEQVAGTKTRSEGGLGIGLALVRGIVALHGGTIAVHSEGSGRGSEFTVRVPLAEAEASEVRVQTRDRSAIADDHLRVLVADDNEDAANSLAMLLTLAGHDVRVAYGGNTALSVAQTFRPQVAIRDIGMPDLDGPSVARALRREPWGTEIFLVALSGWGQEENKRQAQAAGFDTHLTKPVDPNDLNALLLARKDGMRATGLPGTRNQGVGVN